MEPLTSGAIAVAALILNKALEKSGEKLGEGVSQQIGKLWQLIRHTPLPQITAIEQAEQPVNFGQTVLEIETATVSDPELAETVNQLTALVQADPALLQKLQTTAQAVQAEPALMQNNAKLAEKIGIVVQGGTVNLDTMNF